MKGKIRGRRKAPLRDSFFSSHSKNFSLKERRQINNPNYTKLLTLPTFFDDYFTKKFLLKFDQDNKDLPDASVRTPFAHISRTICVAFTALAARYHQHNLKDSDITMLISSPSTSEVYKMLRDLGDMKFLLPIKLYTDAYNAALDKLFTAIIEEGITIYSFKSEQNKSLTAANFLKNDENYYLILQKRWAILRSAIRQIFADV